MKKNMIIAMTAMFLLAGTFTANAQTEAKNQSSAQKQSTPLATGRGDGGEAYTPEQVDQRAMFPGGQEGMMSFMMRNMKYPAEAEKDKAQGTVVVHFVIEADGSISNIKVPDSLKIHPALDAAAMEFVKKMPKWKPAKLKGKTVRQSASHAVQFRCK